MEKTIQELAELLNIVPGAGIILDTDDKVIFWNKMAEEIYGWSIDDISGQDIKIIFDTTLFDYTEVKKTLMHEGKWSGELYNKRKDGQSLTSDGRFVLVTDDSGAPKFISGICIDISAIKTLERNIYQVQRLDSLGTLAGNIAHDINNILSTVLLSVEILRKNSPNESSSRILDTIATSTGRGSGIIKQLLTFSRSVRDEKCEIQPKYLVVEIGKLIEHTFPKSIELDLKIPRTSWTVKGNDTLIHQVLLNLAFNARDAMPKGGILRISLENIKIDDQYAIMRPRVKPGYYVAVEVSDTGVGIPPDMLRKIFDKYFTTKSAGKGSGIGLSIVSSIVDNHKGFLNVYSVLGKGTTFRVYFPALSREETAEREVDQPAVPKGRGEIILLVDDEAPILEITKQTLEANGYGTLIARDGTEALVLYIRHKESIGAVITDVVMPNLDGAGVIRALHSIDPKVKIIAMSGLSIDELIEKPIRPMVHSYLQKPYSAQKLLSSLLRALHEAPRHNTVEVEYNPAVDN